MRKRPTNLGIAVPRSFRLARLVRLIRNFPQVQAQVLNLIKVARPAAAQSVIIIIFILIFSIMGKDLLGATLMAPVPGLALIAANARVYVRARQLPGAFARLHPGRVLRVDPVRARFPVLVEVVQSWSVFSLHAPKRLLWAAVSESKWDEIAGWGVDPCSVAAGGSGAAAVAGAEGGQGLEGDVASK